MKFKEEIKGKYVTATTRRANYTDLYFGKMTIWLSENDYKWGNCEGVITVNNIYLGNDNNPDAFNDCFRTTAHNILSSLEKEAATCK